MKKLKVITLMTILLVGSMSQVACGRATTLDKAGRMAIVLARGLTDQVASLKAAGLTGPKVDAAERTATRITAAANSLNAILEGAKTIDSRDAAQVASYVATIAREIGLLLQNPNFLGFGEASTIVKIARYTSIAANQLALTLAVFFPPPAPGTIGTSSADHKVVATSKIRVDFPEAPAEIKALFGK